MLAPQGPGAISGGHAARPCHIPVQAAANPGFPPQKIKFLPASVPNGKEREAEMIPVGVRGQISPNGILGREDANPLPITTGSFLLSVTCWCRVLNFSIS